MQPKRHIVDETIFEAEKPLVPPKVAIQRHVGENLTLTIVFV